MGVLGDSDTSHPTRTLNTTRADAMDGHTVLYGRDEILGLQICESVTTFLALNSVTLFATGGSVHSAPVNQWLYRDLSTVNTHLPPFTNCQGRWDGWLVAGLYFPYTTGLYFPYTTECSSHSHSAVLLVDVFVFNLRHQSLDNFSLLITLLPSIHGASTNRMCSAMSQ
jgi:hypothetical protein